VQSKWVSVDQTVTWFQDFSYAAGRFVLHSTQIVFFLAFKILEPILGTPLAFPGSACVGCNNPQSFIQQKNKGNRLAQRIFLIATYTAAAAQV
jgi:hypothetical protein